VWGDEDRATQSLHIQRLIELMGLDRMDGVRIATPASR
jgi:hypothetical protein